MYCITTLLDKNINTFAHTHLIIKILNQIHYMSWVYPCCALDVTALKNIGRCQNKTGKTYTYNLYSSISAYVLVALLLASLMLFIIIYLVFFCVNIVWFCCSGKE